MLSRDRLYAPRQTLLGTAGGAVRRLSAYANVPSFHRLPNQKTDPPIDQLPATQMSQWSAGSQQRRPPAVRRHGDPVAFAAMARAGQDGEQ